MCFGFTAVLKGKLASIFSPIFLKLFDNTLLFCILVEYISGVNGFGLRKSDELVDGTSESKILISDVFFSK